MKRFDQMLNKPTTSCGNTTRVRRRHPPASGLENLQQGFKEETTNQSEGDWLFEHAKDCLTPKIVLYDPKALNELPEVFIVEHWHLI